MKRYSLALYIVFIILCINGCSALAKIEETKNLEIGDPEISSLADGFYEGSYDGGFVVVETVLEIRDGTLQDMKLIRHDNGKGEAAEAIVQDLLEAQSLDVDVISGASISSKAILKAAERALTAPPK